MVLKVVGVQRLDCRFDDGKELHGVKLHCLDMETEKKGLEGHVVTSLFVPDDNRYSAFGFEVDKDYRIYFAQKSNKIDFVQEV